MAIITDNGIVLRTIDEVIEDNTDRWGTTTGDVNVDPSSAAGELIAIESEIEARIDQDIAAAALNNTIQSSGVYLDYVGSIKGVNRLTSVPTIVYCKVTGTNGTVILQGESLTCSSNGEIFETQYQVTISGGEAYVAASSVNIGVACPAGTIDFTTPIAGASITNNRSGAVGFDTESDESYRERIKNIPLCAMNMKEGLYSALLTVSGVTKAAIVDNITDDFIEDVPPRYFAPIVLGGDTAEVAQVIYNYMGVGNPSFGTTQQRVTSNFGVVYLVNFTRPTETLVTIVINVGVEAGTDTASLIGQIKNAIVEYMEDFEIGENLYIQAIEALAFFDGVTSSSATLNGLTANILASYKDILYTNEASITVNIV